jgi:single-strand DNA-binding protein
MANLNKVFLIGNLTADPELRYTPNGTAVADLRLAVNREFSSREGDRRSETLFVDAVVWQRQAENCSQYLSKGSPLMVEGRLQLDTWENQRGEKRSKIRVVAENVQFLGRPRDKTDEQETAAAPRAPDENGPPEEDIGEDDIPF